jgi:hypothetical protein
MSSTHRYLCENEKDEVRECMLAGKWAKIDDDFMNVVCLLLL